MVKVSGNRNDWTAPAVLEIAGNNASPSLVVMPDGAFVLFYGRRMGNQADLFAGRSTDGSAWTEEFRLTDTPNQFDEAPFAVAGKSAGVVELYWAQTPDLTLSGSTIVGDGAMVVLDPVFNSGFGD